MILTLFLEIENKIKIDSIEVINWNKFDVTGKVDCAGAFWLKSESAQQLLRIDISSCAGSKKSQKAPA